jgi:hypothetical protein
MAGTMNTRKQVEAARKESLDKLMSGEWKREFDEIVIKYRNENNPEFKDSLKSALNLMSKRWGIDKFPELKQYAEDILKIIDDKPKSASEFIHEWRNK